MVFAHGFRTNLSVMMANSLPFKGRVGRSRYAEKCHTHYPLQN